jgi:hypothetical protein
MGRLLPRGLGDWMERPLAETRQESRNARWSPSSSWAWASGLALSCSMARVGAGNEWPALGHNLPPEQIDSGWPGGGGSGWDYGIRAFPPGEALWPHYPHGRSPARRGRAPPSTQGSQLDGRARRSRASRCGRRAAPRHLPEAGPFAAASSEATPQLTFGDQARGACVGPVPAANALNASPTWRSRWFCPVVTRSPARRD